MSYDFEIATYSCPEEDSIRTFVPSDASLILRGSWSDPCDPTLYVASGPTDADVLMLIEAPKDLTDDDYTSDYLNTVVGAQWMTRITIPVASGRYGRALARKIAIHVATTFQGAAYDPQSERYLVWTKQAVRPRNSDSDDVHDVLRIYWMFSLQTLSVFSLNQFNSIVRTYALACEIHEPKDSRLMAVMKDSDDVSPIIYYLNEASEESGRPSAMRWKTKYPFYEGVTRVNKYIGGGGGTLDPAWSIDLIVDRNAVVTEPQWLVAIEKLFVRTAREVGATYGAVYGCKDIVISRDGPGRTSSSVDYVVPTWAGLPEFVPWLAWYGEGYMQYVHLNGVAQAERYGESLLLKEGRMPGFEARGDVKNLAVPSELVQRSGWRRREVAGGAFAGTSTWYEADRAKVIPRLRGV